MPGVTTAYQTGVHGSRPAANAGCILYSCTTHSLVYRSDGSSWSTFLTLSGFSGDAVDVDYDNSGSGLAATNVQDAIDEVAGAGSGGAAISDVGYPTIGGSTEAIVHLRQYMKKFTVASSGVLMSVGAYIKQTSAGNLIAMRAAVLTDNAGDPDYIIGQGPGPDNGLFLANSNGVAGDARWLWSPVNALLPAAGDYWLACMFAATASTHNIYKDGSGSDRYYTNGGWRITDSGWTAVTTSTDKFSIRGLFLS